MKTWKNFAAIIPNLNRLDRWLLVLEVHRRLMRYDLRSIYRRIPRHYYLAPLQMLIFFGYTGLMGVDASKPWPVLLSIYGASLSTAISVWVFARC
jgi:hypothetical protein